jgi:hypothetical protein
MKGATVVTVINIANNPTLQGTVKSVSGIKVTTNTGNEKLMFLNLANSSVTLNAGDLIPTATSVEQLSGSLTAQSVKMHSIRFSKDLVLPAYSLTIISN